MTNAFKVAGFVAALGLGEVSEGTDTESLVFRANPDLLRLGDSHKLSAEAVLRQAEAFAPLVEAFPEGDRPAEKQALEERLEDFDDVQVDVAWGLENKRLGRRCPPPGRQAQVPGDRPLRDRPGRRCRCARSRPRDQLVRLPRYR